MSKCRFCEQALVIELDPDSFDEATASSSVGSSVTAPDDVQLTCGCHFHWQCLLDESTQVALSLACPACDNSIVSPGPQPHILVRYHNEGGIQTNLDILPLMTEEAYLEANPAARPARAFMTMCAEGDVSGIVQLLKDLEDNEVEEEMSSGEILRFQDPLDGMKTGLIVAVLKGQHEVVWLLLWLASGLHTQAFPEEVSRVAQVVGADRATASGVDIRTLYDEQSRTAEDCAQSMGDTWRVMLGEGWLSA